MDGIVLAVADEQFDLAFHVVEDLEQLLDGAGEGDLLAIFLEDLLHHLEEVNRALSGLLVVVDSQHLADLGDGLLRGLEELIFGLVLLESPPEVAYYVEEDLHAFDAVDIVDLALAELVLQ